MLLLDGPTSRLDAREPVLRENEQYGLGEFFARWGSAILSRRRRIWPENEKFLPGAAQILHSAALHSG